MRILVSNPRRYAPVRRLGLLLLFAVAAQAQPPETHLSSNYVLLRKGESLDDIIRDAAHVVPSPRQWSWQQLEFTGFLHFGMNTFANLEWGTGKASPALFNPTGLDARQWVRVAKEAGIRELILTAKHHDGFCLWPSKYSEYSVRNSPWRHGKGDVVKDIAEACKEAGLKFGVYLSPWDRHDPSYGDSPKYNRHFLDQLGELLTDYGPISEVWFDGANGEGPNGKRQVYDWHAYYALIRKLQPNAVIAIMGPDVRWVGTESGYGRKTEWSVLPASTLNVDSVAAHSQQTASDAAFVPRDLMAEDLGSREQLAHARALAWYPSETDVSSRRGWYNQAR
jgi:alpha-L-fucosidase